MMNLLGSWTSPTWIMPSRLARLAAKLGAPGMGVNVLGIPAIFSDNCGSRIILLDANDILYGDSGTEIGVAGEASLIMTDSPQSSPRHSELVSLWQNDL